MKHIDPIKLVLNLALAFSLFVSASILVRPIETAFFPVVGKIEVTEVYERANDSQTVFVSFPKFRDCEFVGLRMSNPVGYRVNFQFEDVIGDSYQSRPEGENYAGPWRIFTNYDLLDLKIESIHLCDTPFGEHKVTSIMNEGI